jgi:porphobilinogen synthase
VSPTTLVRGRLRDHPLWSRALAAPEIVARLIQPVIVSARVEDRERVPDLPFLERLSLTELVRDARDAASSGLAGFLIFAASDRKDELALLASERDHIVARAIHAVKDAAPDLAVATDVCVCAYTPHGQCVLFAEGQANVSGTLDRLAEIAAVHADAGADMLLPSGMLEGSVRTLRAAVASAGRPELPIAAMVKLESVLYGAHRVAVEAVSLTERAVPLVAVEDRDGARARAAREVAAGADAVVLKPGLVTLDLVTRVSESVDRPVISFFTADEHAFFTPSDDSRDLVAAERESFGAARRAGADLLISYGARSATSE